jgi:hypothetical protein
LASPFRGGGQSLHSGRRGSIPRHPEMDAISDPRVQSVARIGHIDRSHSPRLTQVSLERHFALATPCAHVPGRYPGPSNLKSRVAHPWSWDIGSSTSAAQTSLNMVRSRRKARPFGLSTKLGASGKRSTIPEGNDAVARALFDGLRNRGQRVLSKERAM